MLKKFEEFEWKGNEWLLQDVKIGDMVYVEPDYRHKNFTPGTQYEVVYVEIPLHRPSAKVSVFDDKNNLAEVPLNKILKVEQKADEDEVRWYKDGKLEED